MAESEVERDRHALHLIFTQSWAHLTSKNPQPQPPQIQSSAAIMETSSSDESLDPADALTDHFNCIYSIF
ncbi:hypothetical protein L2E82_34417 [Cichorium intybus]|uniref:Uncharacterized protein n=1 Tax=Cichorium intybus TaxID=13427 RepID=A0ACB9BM29_CICIN|nr:hypothetical protein L2E82_34417 [Cichorium intybus]